MVEVSEVRMEPGSRPWTRLFGRAQEGVDPAEPWETPLRSFDPAWRQAHPFRPATGGDVPVGALTALETACGPLGLDALLVIPSSTRLASQRRSVLTPTEVLAFGETTVALWIGDGTDGRVLSVPHRRLAAIVDRHVLLHGRLTLVGEEQDIIIRYNTVARPLVAVSVVALRNATAGTLSPVQPAVAWIDPRGERVVGSALPYKWSGVLGSRTIRADPDEPVAIAIGDVEGTGRRRPPTGVALLTPRELVIAEEPTNVLDWARHGIDLVAVPRERLDGLRWDGRRLAIELVAPPRDGRPASLSLDLDPWLVRAMRVAFGSQAAWRDGQR